MFSFDSYLVWGVSSVDCSVLLAGSHGCKITTFVLYGLSLSSFVAVAGDDFETPVSCARHASVVCGVFSNLAHISSIFFFDK
jgi:hypothetical protein